MKLHYEYFEKKNHFYYLGIKATEKPMIQF